jgi:4-amino-4-deoxy-L-arabinose transferase-like glycosyltransferase
VTRNRRSFICGVWSHRQLICAGLALLLYLVGLGRPPLWEPDEGRYAEIAREMVASHDYITPRDNFVRYFEKPPLVYWLTAASIKILGPNEFAVRLQAAIASAGQVAITGALGEQMFGAISGVIAALALALSPLFFAFARFATPDPALAFFFTAAMTCFYAWAKGSILDRRSLEKPSRSSACAQERPESGRPWRMVSLPTLQEVPSVPPAQDPAEGIETRWMLAAATMLALGTLTKGPVALVLGCTTATLWLVVEHRFDDVFSIPWLKCGALYLGIVLPWFILVARRNPGFLDFFIVHEHLKRFLESTEHSWGPWFYIPITIAGTWPWFYFVPLAIAGPVVRCGARWLFAKRIISQQGSNADPKDRDPDPALRFLLIWFAVVVVFFSIPRSKLGQYILPGLPPIAILAGYGLTQTQRLETTHRRRLLMIFAGINISAAMAMMLAVVAVSGPLSQILRRDALILAAALFAAGVASMFFSTAGTGLATLALAISVLLEMSAGIDARERVAAMVSYRKLARIIRPYTNRGCSLISYGHFEQALPFYTGVRETLVNYRGELGPFGPGRDPSGDVFATTAQLRRKWAGADCAVLVVNGSDVRTLAKLLSPVPILIGCEGKKFAFFNRPVVKPASDCPDPAACRTEKSQCS